MCGHFGPTAAPCGISVCEDSKNKNPCIVWKLLSTLGLDLQPNWMLRARRRIVSIFKVDPGSTLWIESPLPRSSQSHLSWQAAYQTDTKEQRRRTAPQRKSCSALLHLLFIPFFHVKLALRLPVKAEAVALWQLCESTEHLSLSLNPSLPLTHRDRQPGMGPLQLQTQ